MITPPGFIESRTCDKTVPAICGFAAVGDIQFEPTVTADGGNHFIALSG